MEDEFLRKATVAKSKKKMYDNAIEKMEGTIL